jgi:hypothetical protein
MFAVEKHIVGVKSLVLARHQWLTHVIVATQEAEIRRM